MRICYIRIYFIILLPNKAFQLSDFSQLERYRNCNNNQQTNKHRSYC